jgi:hypothetical protein
MNRTRVMMRAFPLLAAVVAASATAQPVSADVKKEYGITVEKLPKTIEEFTAMRDKTARTPEGGVVMLLIALKMYQDDRTEGYKALVLATDRSELVESNRAGNYKGFVLGGYTPDALKSAFERFPYLAHAYFPGTKPEDGYALGKGPYRFAFTPHRYRPLTDTEFSLFVPSAGTDSPRPMHLKKNDKGLWKASNYSSFLVGVRKPPEPEEHDDL